jgi:hypothetical protein
MLCPITAYLCAKSVVSLFNEGVVDLESARVIDLEEVQIGGEVCGD